MAVPVGYEAFHSLRRKSVTLLCFLLATAMITGTTTYVDSYSIYYWDEATNIGDTSFSVYGPEIWTIADEVREIDGVIAAAALNFTSVTIFAPDHGLSGDAYAPTEEFIEEFPNIFTLVHGRLPRNRSEIALNMQSVEIWDWLSGDIGEELTIVYDYEGGEPEPVTVVGTYRIQGVLEQQTRRWEFEYSVAIVAPDTISTPGYTILYGGVDRSRVSPFDAFAARAFLSEIEEQIRALDPSYSPSFPSSMYWLDNYLLRAVNDYINWQMAMRVNQLLRAGPVIVLVLMVSFLAIRFNVNERRYESNMLMARGASERDVNRIVNREILILALASTFIGLGLGVLVSRIAMASVAYFEVDTAMLIQEPLLVSRDSMILSLLVGFALPILTLIGYRTIYSTRKSMAEDPGRMAKIVKGLGIIKWDVVVVAMSVLLMVAFQAGGQVVQSNFLLRILASILPLPVFLGIASLVIKGLRKAANLIARILAHVFGEVSAFVGIRRIGKEASSAGPAIMVLVLAISLAWNSAVLNSSLPETYLVHSKFAMGSDVSFQLDDFREERWDEFFENVTAHEVTEDATLVTEVTLYLTDDWNSRVVLVGINPDEYAQIGYDHMGQRLNETDIASLLDELDLTMDGVIISSDIASDYEMSVGDIIRTFNFDSPPSVFEFRVIGIVEAIPEQLDVEQARDYYYWESRIGARRAWINSIRASDLLNASSEVGYFCAVRSRSGSNETALVEDILENGGAQVLKEGRWGAVSLQVQAYVSQVVYRMDRATDTMLTVITIGMILGGFGVYAAEGLRARRREIALLRSMGAQRNLIVKAQGVELIVLTLLGLIVLFGYAPIFITTSLVSSQASYSSWASQFPVSLFPIIPWIDLIVVLAFFSVTVLAFVVVIATLSSRVQVALALNAAWAEAGPYGGDL